MATRVKQENYVKTALRLPPELHATLHEAAEKNSRTYNAEIVSRLLQSFGDEPPARDFRQEQQLLEALMRRTVLLSDLQVSRVEIELLQLRMQQMTTDEERAVARAQITEHQKMIEHTKVALDTLNELISKAEFGAAKTTG